MNTVVLALVMVVLTVTLHILGTSVSIAYATRVWGKQIPTIGWLRMKLLMAGIVSVLLLTHFLEAALWAALYWWWEILPTFSTAFYYSLTSYTTVGYGDVVLPQNFRVLGPIEGLLGVLMMGWSTAIVVAIVGRHYRAAVETSV